MNPTTHFAFPRYGSALRKYNLLDILVLLALATLIFLACIAAGCATTPAGLAREATLYQASTNIVGTIQQIVPVLPPAAQFPAETALGVVTALLAAWNLHQHQAISTLKKNGNGNGNGVAKTTLSPPALSPPTPS